MPILNLSFRSCLALGVLLLTLIPVSVFSRALLHNLENDLEAELRHVRTQLTRTQQNLHRLREFSKALGQDPELRSVVQAGANKNKQWQSSVSRTRLKLRDALDQSLAISDKISRLSLDWLESSNSSSPEALSLLGETKQIWLSVAVASVPDGHELLSGLERIVAPYPLQAHACSYRFTANKPAVEMRCLLSLTAWTLPLTKLPETVSEQPIEQPAATLNEHSWFLFTQPNHLIEVQPLENKSRDLASVQPPIQVLSKGVFTGPAGTLVIHGQ